MERRGWKQSVCLETNVFGPRQGRLEFNATMEDMFWYAFSLRAWRR